MAGWRTLAEVRAAMVAQAEWARAREKEADEAGEHSRGMFMAGVAHGCENAVKDLDTLKRGGRPPKSLRPPVARSENDE